jgi:hypothetical protein
MAEKEREKRRGPNTGPKAINEESNDSWSRETGRDPIPDQSDTTDDRIVQMRHGDESAELERSSEKPATADFFETLDAEGGEDARRAEGE